MVVAACREGKLAVGGDRHGGDRRRYVASINGMRTIVKAIRQEKDGWRFRCEQTAKFVRVKTCRSLLRPAVVWESCDSRTVKELSCGEQADAWDSAVFAVPVVDFIEPSESTCEIRLSESLAKRSRARSPHENGTTFPSPTNVRYRRKSHFYFATLRHLISRVHRPATDRNIRGL